MFCCDPGISDLGQAVLQGRVAAFAIQKQHYDDYDKMSVPDKDFVNAFSFDDWSQKDTEYEDWGEEFDLGEVEDI